MQLFRFELLKRRDDISHQEFSDHWRTKHVEVLLSSGHREYNLNYVQNDFRSLPGSAPAELRFDGAPQMLQRDLGVIQSGFQQDPRYMKCVRPDEENFMDPSKTVTLFTQAVELARNADSQLKLMAFIAFADRRALPEQHQSLDRLQREALKLDAGRLAVRCSHYHCLDGTARGLPPFPDAVVEYGIRSEADGQQIAEGCLRQISSSLGSQTLFSAYSDERRVY